MIKRQPVTPKISEEISIEDKPIHIQYDRPTTSRRIFSSILDFLIFTLIALLIFASVKAIVDSTPSYSLMLSEYEQIQLDSKIYAKYDDNKNELITTYYDNIDTIDTTAKKMALKDAIDGFIAYSIEDSGSNHIVNVQEEYDNYRISSTYNDANLFSKNDEGIIVENSGIKSETFINYCYSPFIEDKCVGFLSQNFPTYLNYQKTMSYYLIFLEVPLSIILGSILTFFVPGLIFKRGMKSFAKLCFHISLVDKEYLSLPLKQYVFRFLIIFFFEIVLSCFTFGIPLLISASFLAFSKNKQPIHDYLLKIEAIDTTTDKVYFSKQEIRENYSLEAKPMDFKMK